MKYHSKEAVICLFILVFIRVCMFLLKMNDHIVAQRLNIIIPAFVLGLLFRWMIYKLNN